MKLQNPNAPIGIFDSGVGGLTVLSTLRKNFPHESFIYYADNGNMPYGNKTPEQIKGFSRSIISWFQNIKKVKMVVAACNTSSALALDEIADEFDIPIIGTIHPLAKTIISSNFKSVGILATSATVSSQFHEKALRKHGYQGAVVAVSCPDFVPLIESADFNPMALQRAAQNYVGELQHKSIDSLVYGCTHYPLIRHLIEPLLPRTIKHLCPSESMCEILGSLLFETKSTANKGGSHILFYCHRDKEAVAQKIKFFTDIQEPNVELVNIESKE